MKTKKVVLDLISFGTPEAIAFNLIVIFLVLAMVPTNSLNDLPTKCLFHSIILPAVFHGDCPTTSLFANCECPACGMTHAMSRLLHGDLTGAWNFNRGVFLVFGVMISVLIVNCMKVLRRKRLSNHKN